MVNAQFRRARQLSLAWLIIGVMTHGTVQAHFGNCPQSSGLTRLSRDLIRKFAVKEHSALASNPALLSSLTNVAVG
jgi:hypothetical protein